MKLAKRAVVSYKKRVRMPSKGIAAKLISMAVFLCCAMTLALVPGCGGDMLATTQQAQSGAQSSDAATSDGVSARTDEAKKPASNSASMEHAIEVIVEIDCENAHAYNAKFPETLGTFAVNIPKGATVLDALAATGVEYGMRGKDYVSSIGGIEDKVCGRDSGWLYLVNGTQPPKTATEFTLEGGESVRWAYTVTEGDVSEE